MLKRLIFIFSSKAKGSLVIESLLVFPFLILVLFFIIGVFHYFFVASFIDHRVDSFSTYVVGVGEGEVEFEGFSFDLASSFSGDILSSYLLEGGVLEKDRLLIDCQISEGYLAVQIEYRLSLLLFGDILIFDNYERRLWQ